MIEKRLVRQGSVLRTHLLQHDGLVHRGVPSLRLEAEAGCASPDPHRGKLEKIPAQDELDATERLRVPL